MPSRKPHHFVPIVLNLFVALDRNQTFLRTGCLSLSECRARKVRHNEGPSGRSLSGSRCRPTNAWSSQGANRNTWRRQKMFRRSGTESTDCRCSCRSGGLSRHLVVILSVEYQMNFCGSSTESLQSSGTDSSAQGVNKSYQQVSFFRSTHYTCWIPTVSSKERSQWASLPNSIIKTPIFFFDQEVKYVITSFRTWMAELVDRKNVFLKNWFA